MQKYLKFCIAQVSQEGHVHHELFTYLIDKFKDNFCEKSSYYETILNFKGTYFSINNNIAESLNGNLNNFVLKVSKSSDLNVILKRLKLHYIVTVRDVERQIKLLKSEYCPTKVAIQRFQKARIFVQKISVMNRENNERFFKKLSKLIDSFYEDQ